jgi:hypothetical protein
VSSRAKAAPEFARPPHSGTGSRLLGSHLAGLLSPFPVFGAVLAIFTHRTHGPTGAVQVLDGLLLGLLAPAVFFLVLALMLPALGLFTFASATAAAITTHVVAMLAIPRDQPLP